MSIIKPWSNFNRSACPKSLRWRNNYRALRRRPGLRELSAQDFWVQEKKDFERLPKCRKYLAERRRRPATAAMRAHMATLGALPDGGVASAEVAAEVNAEAVQVSRNAPPGALAERVLGARSAAVAKRARELALSAFDEYMADRIDAAEFDRRKAEARAKATAEHAPLTELERASAEYTQAVSARTKAEAALLTSEAAEDAAEAKLEAVLRGLERGQPGASGVKTE